MKNGDTGAAGDHSCVYEGSLSFHSMVQTTTFQAAIANGSSQGGNSNMSPEALAASIKVRLTTYQVTTCESLYSVGWDHSRRKQISIECEEWGESVSRNVSHGKTTDEPFQIESYKSTLDESVINELEENRKALLSKSPMWLERREADCVLSLLPLFSSLIPYRTPWERR